MRIETVAVLFGGCLESCVAEATHDRAKMRGYMRQMSGSNGVDLAGRVVGPGEPCYVIAEARTP
jgi:hypothetical protein